MMAEKRDCEENTDDDENDVLRKRLKTNISDNTCSDISDNTSSEINDDTSSESDGSVHQSGYEDRPITPDPLSDLTKDQRIVLYTLLLCDGDSISMDDDVSMGDIDVRKTVEELKDRGLVRCYRVLTSGDDDLLREVEISNDRDQIMRSYRENCLLSDIDKDFFLQVASEYSILTYTRVYLYRDDSISPPDSSPITTMRLMMEGWMEVLDLTDYIIGVIPENILEEPEDFIQFWKTWFIQRDIHPTDWSDGVCDKDAKRYASVYTILSGYEKELLELVLDQKKWNTLILILMSEKYSILCEETSLKEKMGQIQQTFPTLHDSEDGISDNLLLIKELVNSDKILTMNRENNSVGFISEGIRHQVMGYFVLNCLKTDEDYNNFIKLASLDLLFEYARTLGYLGEKKERCVFFPRTMEEILITKIGIDIVRHVTVNDDSIKSNVSETLNIPSEILDWDLDARCRYVQCAKKGTQTIHRARAMIVGCAGAGKTTLLKRLEKRSLNELRQVQSTLGLEVHEDIFEILKENDFLRVVTEETDKEGKQLLSIMDFGGQCAYYACHQVYLSRRAFYLLVIDMSKSFDEKVDPAICEQEGTMFADWTYGEYILFWLKSVHTYCDSDAPVVIVGTHLDRVKKQNSDTFYNSILDQLQYNKHLKAHLDRKRCFILGFQSDGESFHDTFSELEKCIVEITKEERWKETIPTDWALCEVVFREIRRRDEKMLSVQELSGECFGRNTEKYAQMGDILKFYHDIGVILHFNESSLNDTVIMDIQWFIDSFKKIITDPNHVRDIAENNRDWNDFYKSGQLLDRLLTIIWEFQDFSLSFWDNYLHKENLLRYMERLGLIAVGTVAHYIPCMNKRTFGVSEENFFKSLANKTSVLVFRFQFLPYFFYFRLIVACLTRTNKEWRVLQDSGLCLYKNVACFAYKQHAVALAVNTSSIQLQVFQPKNTTVTKKVALEVRDTIQQLLNDLLENFHKKIEMYTVGFQCLEQEVFCEHDDCFVEEEFLRKGSRGCPRHELINSHTLSESDLLYFWNLDVLAEPTDPDTCMEKGDYSSLTEPDLKKVRFQCFEKLTGIGREALQVYFDKVFPPTDLFMLLQKKKENLRRQLNTDQFYLMFPADKSIPTSSAFDVTIMYKLLRNYSTNLPTPTKGWGKAPEPGQKSPTDDVERIRIYRNEVEHKTPATSVMEKGDCCFKWRDLCQAILRLSEGSLEQDIMALRHQK